VPVVLHNPTGGGQFLVDDLLKENQINDVSEHVLSLTNRATDTAAAKEKVRKEKEIAQTLNWTASRS